MAGRKSNNLGKTFGLPDSATEGHPQSYVVTEFPNRVEIYQTDDGLSPVGKPVATMSKREMRKIADGVPSVYFP